jgi:hypothetical protein
MPIDDVQSQVRFFGPEALLNRDARHFPQISMKLADFGPNRPHLASLLARSLAI